MAEEAHQLEFQEQRELWEQRLAEYEQRADDQIKDLEHKHRVQMRDLAESARTRSRPRPTSELLNLMKIEENLVKKQDYLEAKKVAKRIDAIRQEEVQKGELTRRRKLEVEAATLLKKQQVEMDALKTRLQSGYNELSHERSLAIERLLQKYQNVKKELTVHHKLDLQRVSSPWKAERYSSA